MGLVKRTYVDGETVITAENLNDIQNAIIQNEEDIATKGTYSKPTGGIPKTDLSSAVQTSLGKADTALQSSDIDNTLAVAGKAADAKKTGDEISDVRNTLEDAENILDVVYKKEIASNAAYESKAGDPYHNIRFDSFSVDGAEYTVSFNDSGTQMFSLCPDTLLTGHTYKLVFLPVSSSLYCSFFLANSSGIGLDTIKAASTVSTSTAVNETYTPNENGYFQITITTANANDISYKLGVYDVTEISSEILAAIDFTTFAESYEYESGKIINIESEVDAIKSNWNGLKFTSYGDSTVQQNRWQPYVVNQLKLDHTNRGVGGSTVSDLTDGLCTDARVNTIPSDSDVIVILAGINDWNNSIPLGDAIYTNTDTSTFCGALNVMFRKILARCPDARIITMGTTCAKRLYYPTWADGRYNTLNLSTMDYNDAIGKISKFYGAFFADVYAKAGWNWVNIADFVANDGNYIHFDADHGGKRVAEVAISALMDCNPVGGIVY